MAGSDRPGEFGERVLDPPVWARVGAELVVPAADVLHQGVTADDHTGGVIAFESAHRPEPRFEPSVIAFDTVVRILLGVVKRRGYEALDRGPQRWCSVGHDLDGVLCARSARAKPACGSDIASSGDEHVDDLTVLVHRPVDVASSAGNLHVGLVDEPTIADRVSARSGRVREQWGEAPHPPVDRDVIDLDSTLNLELLDISMGEPKPQIPPYGVDNDLRWEPKALER